MNKKEIDLRDRFAGIAMHGMLSNHVTSEAIAVNVNPNEYESAIAKAVYKMADAMMGQRKK